MDGRDAILYSNTGLGHYVPQRGVSVPMPVTHSIGLTDPNLGFTHLSNEGSVLLSSDRGSGFQTDNLNNGYQHNANIGSSSGTAQAELVKKKRGRPRKYGSAALVVSPIYVSGAEEPIVRSEKRKRGRPHGSGRKQMLASLGGWMNSSAGTAFATFVHRIESQEDVASRILQFSLQRPRALCIMSGSGTVSSVTLRQPASSDNIFTYEGHFLILSLSGSYLVSEGGSSKRTGGLNISLYSPEGHIFGGVIGGPLIAESPVMVHMCSFVYDRSKSKIKNEEPPRLLKYEQEEGEPSTPASDSRPGHNISPPAPLDNWYK
ncbi:unnamed protein product [Rhodiola kirilowii]